MRFTGENEVDLHTVRVGEIDTMLQTFVYVSLRLPLEALDP